MSVVKPPNETGPGGNKAANGFLPLTRSASPVNPPNTGPGGDRRGGSASLVGQASPVYPPNHAFVAGTSRMPQPPSAVEPGQGAIPVNPFLPSGAPALLRAPVADMARPRGAK